MFPKNVSKGDSQMLLKLLLPLIVLSLGACSSIGGQKLLGDDHIIVPGERLGAIRLGMSEDDLLKIGTPSSTQPLPLYKGKHSDETVPAIRYQFGGKLISVYVERATRRVVQIELGHGGNCGGYHTVESIGCSSTYYNIAGALGDPDNRRADSFSPKLLDVTYFNERHAPPSLTVFSFHPGGSMAVRPVDDVQHIKLIEGVFGDYYRLWRR
jgi:hypothetical protein